jgi:hypothetical protein
MLAGIFATKKRAACFATLRGKKRRRASHRAPEIRVRVIDRSPEAEPTPPPDPEWIDLLRRFETGRPRGAVALSNYPSNCYGLAGGAIAGDASAPGDAIAPLSVVDDFL